ncbi:hypothetical protein C0Z20_23210 [Trinickia symbiotica]|uniref:Uncharacterized protein n=1 Tax=Trinickia symbiotica TaxID=863227 RepID=A0A2N7WZD0_9BURK|nr:hypothetical protein C0Z20_23210 [Trinickia symbiotica]
MPQPFVGQTARRATREPCGDADRSFRMPVPKARYLFIIKTILKDSKVVVCWIAKAFARTSASSS